MNSIFVIKWCIFTKCLGFAFLMGSDGQVDGVCIFNILYLTWSQLFCGGGWLSTKQ